MDGKRLFSNIHLLSSPQTAVFGKKEIRNNEVDKERGYFCLCNKMEHCGM
jgi:hypothetical protein